MTASEEYQHLLDSKGIPLRELGVREVALERSECLNAVDMLQRAGTPILGGDVYFRSEGGIEPAYANWYSEPMPGEDRASFGTRSYLEAKSYIEKFPSSSRQPVFVLVTDE